MGDKKLGIIAGIVFVIIIGVGIFFSTMDKGGEESGAVSLSGTIQPKEKPYPIVDEQYNYSMDMDADIKFPFDGSQMLIDLKGLKTIIFDNYLKSRFAIDELQVAMTGFNSAPKQGDLKRLDLIIEDFNVFANIDPESIKGLLDLKSGVGNEVLDKALSIIKNNKYIKIDNTKVILSMLGDLAENELVRLVVEAIGTNNPQIYLARNKFRSKLKEKLFIVGSYKFFFDMEGDKDEEGKVELKLRSDFCETGLYSGLAYFLEDTYNYKLGDLEECKESVEYLNEILSSSLYLIQTGDNETILYNGLVDLKITYGGGELKKFNIQKQGVGKFDFDGEAIVLKLPLELLTMMGYNANFDSEFDLVTKNGSVSGNFDYDSISGSIYAEIKDGKIVDRSAKIDLADDYFNEALDSKVVSDLKFIERALNMNLSDYYGNSIGTLSTGGLTPVYYNGEIISYQGLFDHNFTDSLKNLDEIVSYPVSPIDWNSFIIGVSKDLKYYNIAGVLEDGTPKIYGNTPHSYEINLSTGTIIVNSLIYPGEFVDGKYIINKTQLSGDDYMNFVNDGVLDNLLYTLDKTKIKDSSKFVVEGEGDDVKGQFLIDINLLGEKEFYAEHYYDTEVTTLQVKSGDEFSCKAKFDKMDGKTKYVSEVLAKNKNLGEQIKIQSKGYLYQGSGNLLGFGGIESETNLNYKMGNLSIPATKAKFQVKYLDKNLDLFYSTYVNSIKTEMKINGKLGLDSADLKVESNVVNSKGEEMGKIEGSLVAEKLEMFDINLKGGVMNDAYGLNFVGNYKDKDLLIDGEFWGPMSDKVEINAKVDHDENDGNDVYSGFVLLKNGEKVGLDANIHARITNGGVKYQIPKNSENLLLSKDIVAIKIPIVNYSSSLGLLGGSIVGAVMADEYATEMKTAVDKQRIAEIRKISWSLATYFSDNGMFPNQDNLSGVMFMKSDIVPTYINKLSPEVNGNKIYYASMLRNQTKDAGMILAIELDNEIGNFDVSSIEELDSIIQGKDAVDIEAMIDPDIKSKIYVVVQ